MVGYGLSNGPAGECDRDVVGLKRRASTALDRIDSHGPGDLALVLDHRRQSVQLIPCPAEQPGAAGCVHGGQKRRLPRLDDHQPAAGPQDAVDFCGHLLQVGHQPQVVQPALNGDNVPRAGGIRQPPGVAHLDSRRPAVLRHKLGREIETL